MADYSPRVVEVVNQPLVVEGYPSLTLKVEPREVGVAHNVNGLNLVTTLDIMSHIIYINTSYRLPCYAS